MSQLNSEYLQQVHKKVYEDFFSQSDIVVSSPFAPSFWTDTWMNDYTISLRKKIPSYMYIWTTKSNEFGSIEFWKIHLYNCEKDVFEVYYSHQIIEANVLSLIQNEYKRTIEKYWICKWFTIDILSEQQNGYWFNFVWVLCSLIATVLCSLSEIKKSEYDISEWIEVAKNLYEACSTNQWWLLQHMLCSKSSSTAVSLYSKSNSWDLSHMWSFKDIFKYSDCLDVFDYWCISFGSPHNIINSWWYVTHKIEKYTSTHNFIKNLFEEYNISYISSICNQYDTKKLLYCSKFIEQLIACNKNPHSEKLQRKAITSFEKIWLYELIDDFECTEAQELIWLFMEVAHEKKMNQYIWFSPIYISSTWWTFYFISLKNRSRATLKALKDRMKEKWYQDAYFPYLSRRDGTCSDVIQVKQYISNWIYSSYITKTSVLGRHKDTKKVFQHDKALFWKQELLTLDSIHKKIYHLWEKLTYKSLRSQSATVEILMILISNIWTLIHNSQLPVSSYSKNKNELIWKVINPLKMYMDTIWYAIEIVCRWTLHDFYVWLEKWDEYIYYNRMNTIIH